MLSTVTVCHILSNVVFVHNVQYDASLFSAWLQRWPRQPRAAALRSACHVQRLLARVDASPLARDRWRESQLKRETVAARDRWRVPHAHVAARDRWRELKRDCEHDLFQTLFKTHC